MGVIIMDKEKLQSILEEAKYQYKPVQERYLNLIRKFEKRFDNDRELFNKTNIMYFGPQQGWLITQLYYSPE